MAGVFWNGHEKTTGAPPRCFGRHRRCAGLCHPGPAQWSATPSLVRQASCSALEVSVIRVLLGDYHVDWQTHPKTTLNEEKALG